jgi:hypothetical protein
VSGNPGGRPKSIAEVVEAARMHTPQALDVIVQLMAVADKDETRLRAALAIIERAWGAPARPLALVGEGETDGKLEIAFVVKRDNPITTS